MVSCFSHALCACCRNWDPHHKNVALRTVLYIERLLNLREYKIIGYGQIWDQTKPTKPQNVKAGWTLWGKSSRTCGDPSRGESNRICGSASRDKNKNRKDEHIRKSRPDFHLEDFPPLSRASLLDRMSEKSPRCPPQGNPPAWCSEGLH